MDKVFYYIIKNYKNCMDLTNKDGNTVLYNAIKSSNLTYIKELIN